MLSFPRHAPGVSSQIASFRTPSHNARTYQYHLRSNTGHSCYTVSVPPSPLIRTSSLGGKLVENDGRLARSWLRNAAKLWASTCESSNSYPIIFHPFLFEWPSSCVVLGPAHAALRVRTLTTRQEFPIDRHDLSVRSAGGGGGSLFYRQFQGVST